MRRDFWAIMRLGQLFISKSDNPQNAAAAKKLVYGLADFLSPEDMESTVRMAGMLDFESSVAALTTLGSEELQQLLRAPLAGPPAEARLGRVERNLHPDLLDQALHGGAGIGATTPGHGPRLL